MISEYKYVCMSKEHAMKTTACIKCNREIRNNNYDKHVNACDGTYFTGKHNPTKVAARRSSKSPEEIKQIRQENVRKARSTLQSKPVWNKGKFKYEYEEVFQLNGTNSHLVKRMFMAIVEYKCHFCGLSDWNFKPITLHLDHINGVHHDNRIENLRLLCPNCHSQTPTYCNKSTSGNRKVSDEMIISAITNSTNIRQVLLKIGLRDASPNYKRVEKVLVKYGLTLNCASTPPDFESGES